MNLRKYFCGNEMERIPNIAFKAMTFLFKIRDLFYPFEKRLSSFGIKEGLTIIDYGCGPGGYLEKASRLVGEKGKVYAVDIHELAMESVEKRIIKHNLKNVVPILAKAYSCDIPDQAADIIYAVDMFHMIKEPEPFLNELHRLLKDEGILIIDDGHQSRKKTKEKIGNSHRWRIVEETKDHLKCMKL